MLRYQNAFAVFITLFFYFFFAFFVLRTSFEMLFFLWLMLFGCFYFFLKKSTLSFNQLIGISILFRLVFLFATPNLSQDFYRFIWDGRLILEGYNPYLSTPETFVQKGTNAVNQAQILYQGMGTLNGSHYTNYPPINQLCFFLAAVFSNNSILGSIIVFRLLLIGADLGILYYGKQLLKRMQLPVKNIFWYVLNPFVIIEMTGNVHFEPVMLFFLICGLYQLHQKKWILAAILIACAVSVKLIPLLFLPLFFQWFLRKEGNNHLKFKLQITQKKILKIISFYGIIVGFNLLLFLPFFHEKLLTNYTSSVGLWFKNFEFNASFYYIFRKIGYQIRGYNEIAIISKVSSLLIVIGLLFFTFYRKNYSFKNLIVSLLFGISLYYFLASTVHPWYLAMPLLLCVFTNYRYPVIWTFVVILSYQAYANIPFKENFWFLTLEYLMVYSFFIYELKKVSSNKMIN